MNVDQGDLAIIVKSPMGHNLSRIVEVLHLQGEHSTLGPVWRIKSKGRALVTEYGGIGPECDCPDAWLRRIPPDDADSAAMDARELEAA